MDVTGALKTAINLWKLLKERRKKGSRFQHQPDGFQHGRLHHQDVCVAHTKSLPNFDVFIFGAAASRYARWRELCESVHAGIWNFHSEDDCFTFFTVTLSVWRVQSD
jgi:hypothetical protein